MDSKQQGSGNGGRCSDADGDAPYRKDDAQTAFDGYRDLVDGSDDFIFSCAEDGAVTQLNPATRRALGYDDAPTSELRLQDIVASRHIERLLAMAGSEDAGEESLRLDLDLQDQKGELIPVVASCRARGNGIRPKGVCIIARRSNGRTTTKTRPFNAETLLSTLLENAPDSIYFKDVDSRFVSYSKSMRDLLSLPADMDLAGLTDFDLFDDQHATDAFEDEQYIIRTGQPLLDKLEKETHADGTVTWALTSKMPWRDESGRIIGTFGISKNVTKVKEAEEKLEELHKRLVEASRTAGMAEVANDVLHNVGNVLTSVNVACSMATERVERSRLAGLGKLAALLEEHKEDLGHFITEDPAGQRIPEYVQHLRDIESEDRTYLMGELNQLRTMIDHIKQIVGMQQNYAKVSGVIETISVAELIEDALQINAAALQRHGITTRRFIDEVPEITTDKHKVLQIIVNLIRNAKYAMDGRDEDVSLLVMRLTRKGKDHVMIQVEDNGVGIPKENLTRIFAHGFTTREEGHGFGLHSGANAARELGGSLEAHSDGPGKGAVFTLLLPVVAKEGTSA